MFGAKIKSKIDIKKRIKKSKNTTEPYKIVCSKKTDLFDKKLIKREVAICPHPFYLLKQTAISKKESIKFIVKTIKKIQKIKEINFS